MQTRSDMGLISVTIDLYKRLMCFLVQNRIKSKLLWMNEESFNY